MIPKRKGPIILGRNDTAEESDDLKEFFRHWESVHLPAEGDPDEILDVYDEGVDINRYPEGDEPPEGADEADSLPEDSE